MSGPTATYVRDRERVLGRRTHVSHDPVAAADQLERDLGRDGALAWARHVLDVLVYSR